ncbi:Exonuclease mut-7 [Phytophthora cinnamomi]|uniref:Exonuclease mut-7 n=1 Tax=Phytophthora cinnamomi TaxID=4785 RepID=UPI00355993D5|nr:Exonuclease mut-7 [Phytophthora cinnamomi]
MLELLGPELVGIFHSRCNGLRPSTSGAAAAELWARRIHWAFYSSSSTRGSNKFLALESTLVDVFARLGQGSDAQPFWEFVVRVLLLLAQEPPFEAGCAVGSSKSKKHAALADKKSPKKCQPNAPLAFLVANALRKLVTGEAAGRHAELCRLQGRNNEALRAFCSNGLGNNSTIDQKLLVEMVGLFDITDIDPDLVRNALEHLLASKSHAALIKLCETFANVDWPFETIVTRMVQTKDWTSAELIARTFEQDGDTALAKTLINETINIQDFKRAHRFVSNFNLQKQYPDIDVLYSRDGLMRLIETQRWQLALTFVGHDTILQTELLKQMVAAGELTRADQLEKKMAAAEDGVRGAMQYFFGSFDCQFPGEKVSAKQLVGLDVEWKPINSRSKSTAAVASILQIASSDRVFIIDLLALHDNNFLFDDFLLRLFTSLRWVKLGFSFDSDLKVLHQTFPERQAFATVYPFVDLNTSALKSCGSFGTSLSQSVRHILGKPLDKRMQLSDWEHRPLSQDQLTYAALDALCLVQVAEKLRSQEKDGDSSSYWLEACHLKQASSLTKAEVAEAISLRNQYQENWRQRCSSENEVQRATPLVSPQEVQDMWEERKAARAHELDASLDASLKFLPMDQITAMLQDLEADTDTQDFIAVNSICILIDDTPSVVCIDATRKLDVAQFARFCGVGRRRVRLASASECRDVFGFTPGTVAPFGHKLWVPTFDKNSAQPRQIEVYGDSRLQKARYLAAGSGSQEEVIWVESKAFFALISIKLIDGISVSRDYSRPMSPSPPVAGSNADDIGMRIGSTTESEPTILEYKFLVDSMVTQVGRWLRTIGVDVVAWNPSDVKSTRNKDPKSIMLAYAAKQNRIVLTRDTSLPSRRDAGACFVLSDDECYKQFREVKLQFGLLDLVDTRSSRCARCNSDTFSPIDACSARKEMSERLRKKVPDSVVKFWACDGCGRIYWEGPKYTPAMNPDTAPSPDGRVAYRPVPRKRVAGDRFDQRHLPDPLP